MSFVAKNSDYIVDGCSVHGFDHGPTCICTQFGKRLRYGGG